MPVPAKIPGHGTGNTLYSGQPKVTELSIDMYRMTTLIERSPKFHSSSTITNPLKQVIHSVYFISYIAYIL